MPVGRIGTSAFLFLAAGATPEVSTNADSYEEGRNVSDWGRSYAQAQSPCEKHTMKLHPYFVPGGVYLRTETGELIGRRDKPGEPFPTLEEARGKADWLAMVIHQAQRQRDLVGTRRSVAAGDGNAGNERPAAECPQPLTVRSVIDHGVNYE